MGSYPLQCALWDADVQFFPEGGDLLTSVAKKLAFKAVSSAGKGLKIQGKIIDSKKNEIETFNDIAFGMDAIEFMPVAGESYGAVISYENGEQRIYDRTEIKAEGINIIIHNEDDESFQMALIANEPFFQKMVNQPCLMLEKS